MKAKNNAIWLKCFSSIFFRERIAFAIEIIKLLFLSRSQAQKGKFLLTLSAKFEGKFRISGLAAKSSINSNSFCASKWMSLVSTTIHNKLRMMNDFNSDNYLSSYWNLN